MENITKKNVKIYIYGKCMSHLSKKPGNYAAMLKYKDKSKIIYGFELNTTANRVMINGIIKAVKMLKEPCNIEFYTPTQLGFSHIINKQGDYTKKTSINGNKDILILLREILKKGGHSCKEIVNTDSKKLLQAYCNSKFIDEYEKLEDEQKLVNENNKKNIPSKANKVIELSTGDDKVKYIEDNLNLSLNLFQANRVKDWDKNRMLIAIDKFMEADKDNFSYLQKCYNDSKQ